MSLRDTSDENELTMGYTGPQERMRRGRALDLVPRACYNPENRHVHKETWNAESYPEGRWHKFTYDELITCDKTSLDIF
jgi:hypothetical protein